ncbi:MAG: hypothetical protein ACLUOI_20605 [Eisenbergiella sp.]
MNKVFGTKGSLLEKTDNAAKIFPATSKTKRTPGFSSFYCELKEPVDGSILQSALDKTIDKYPVFYPSA